jgi:F-type H+-transporting ATPase subunit delta
MGNNTISLRYANSLFFTAKEKNLTDKIAFDVERLYKILNENPELRRALESPIIKPALKQSILEKIFLGKIHEELYKFLRFIVEKKRENLLITILKKFLWLRDEQVGIVNMKIKTAYEFSEEQASLIKSKFETKLKKKVRLNFVIDPALIGGFVAQINDTVYDASLKHQLEILKKKFSIGAALSN